METWETSKCLHVLSSLLTILVIISRGRPSEVPSSATGDMGRASVPSIVAALCSAMVLLCSKSCCPLGLLFRSSIQTIFTSTTLQKQKHRPVLFL